MVRKWQLRRGKSYSFPFKATIMIQNFSPNRRNLFLRDLARKIVEILILTLTFRLVSWIFYLIERKIFDLSYKELGLATASDHDSLSWKWRQSFITCCWTLSWKSTRNRKFLWNYVIIRCGYNPKKEFGWLWSRENDPSFTVIGVVHRLSREKIKSINWYHCYPQRLEYSCDLLQKSS